MFKILIWKKRGTFYQLKTMSGLWFCLRKTIPPIKIAAKVSCNERMVVYVLQKHKAAKSMSYERSTLYRLVWIVYHYHLIGSWLEHSLVIASYPPELPQEWKEICSFEVSSSNVRRQCLQYRLGGCKAQREPLLTPEQRKTYMERASNFQNGANLTGRKYSCVLGDSGKTNVRRFPHEEYKSDLLNISLKHLTNVMAWVCMAPSGLRRLHVIGGMVNVEKYIGILKNACCHQLSNCFLANISLLVLLESLAIRKLFHIHLPGYKFFLNICH